MRLFQAFGLHGFQTCFAQDRVSNPKLLVTLGCLFARMSGAAELSRILHRSADAASASKLHETRSSGGGESAVMDASVLFERRPRAAGGWIDPCILLVFIFPLITCAVLGGLASANALAQLATHMASMNRLLDLSALYTHEFNTTFDAILGDYASTATRASRHLPSSLPTPPLAVARATISPDTVTSSKSTARSREASAEGGGRRGEARGRQSAGRRHDRGGNVAHAHGGWLRAMRRRFRV